MKKFKSCTVCKEIKKVDDFSPSKKTSDGFNRRCKECVNAYNRKMYAKNGGYRNKVYEWRRIER